MNIVYPNPLIHDNDEPIHPVDALGRVSSIITFLRDSQCIHRDGGLDLSPEGRDGLNFTLMTLEKTINQAVELLEGRNSAKGEFIQGIKDAMGKGEKGRQWFLSHVEKEGRYDYQGLAKYLFYLLPNEKLQEMLGRLQGVKDKAA